LYTPPVKPRKWWASESAAVTRAPSQDGLEQSAQGELALTPAPLPKQHYAGEFIASKKTTKIPYLRPCFSPVLTRLKKNN
jgi:hypothetical protein